MRRARGRVARARRRSRRAGHREHRRGPRVPDRPRRRAAEPGSATRCASSRGARSASSCAFTSWHNDVWKPVIAAVNGVCAGGGLHFVADADIVIAATDATFLDPHVSVGQASVYETIALTKKSPMEAILRMAFIGAHERMSAARAYQLGICSQVVDRPTSSRDASSSARRSPRTRRPRWPRRSARCGALEAGLTDACRAGARSSSACGATRPGGGPAASPRSDTEWEIG